MPRAREQLQAESKSKNTKKPERTEEDKKNGGRGASAATGTGEQLPIGTRWVSLGEAARLARCSRDTVRAWLRARLVLAFRLPHPKNLGEWRIAVWAAGGAPVRMA